MKKLIQLAGIAFLFIAANSVFAGTVIQIQDGNDLITVSTDGAFARMDMPGDEYVIVNYKKHTIKAVYPKKHQVLLLNANKMSGGKSGPEVRTSLKKLGAGMKVAGYPTQKYAYSANGKSCGFIYGSQDAYQKKGIKELLLAMSEMMEKQRAILGGFAGMVDDCTLADMKLSDHVNTIGVPMRTEKNGVVDSEIKSIKLDVNLPTETFVVPTTYKTVTMDQQMQQYQPQMQQMMQQMQQSGQMTPEMMEQMRRTQEMMKQYQQR